MRAATLLFVAVFALASPARAQAPADFSGTWKLDLSRSDSAAQAVSSGPVTVEIVQSAAQIRIVTTTTRGSSSMTYALSSSEEPALANATGPPTARWQNESLLTNALRDVRGQSVTVQQSRRLSADGNEMVVESIVNVQHGYTANGAQTYGASRDVFVRVAR